MSLYYRIWVDGIVKIRSLPKNAGNWKFPIICFMTMSMAMNFMVFVAILERNILHSNFYDLKINIFPGTNLDAFLSFFFMFFLPPLLINYVLIFRKQRYKVLIAKYKFNNGKLFIGYLLGSLILPFFLLLIGFLLTR